MVLDSHTHAWGPPTPAEPWTNDWVIQFADEFSTSVVFDADRLLADMDATGVDEAVVVGYPIYHWTDNRYTLRTVAAHERLYGIVMLDPFADDAAATLRTHVAVDGVLGFRLAPICPVDRMWEAFDPAADWLRDAIDEEAFWEAARDTDAVVQILAHVDQLDQVRELVRAYPDLTYLVDHFAHAEPGAAPESAFEPLVERDNVAVKISEVVHRSEEAFPYEDVHDHVRWLLDAFGRERVVWGSDYPNVSDEATYEQSLAWLDHVDGLSAADREFITGPSFERHVGLD